MHKCKCKYIDILLLRFECFCYLRFECFQFYVILYVILINMFGCGRWIGGGGVIGISTNASNG